jgi:ABC-type anion transport system duplicated permease subunit
MDCLHSREILEFSFYQQLWRIIIPTSWSNVFTNIPYNYNSHYAELLKGRSLEIPGIEIYLESSQVCTFLFHIEATQSTQTRRVAEIYRPMMSGHQQKG